MGLNVEVPGRIWKITSCISWLLPEILRLGFWSFDVKAFFFFSNYNVSGRYAVKLHHYPINFRTFSYAYLAGRENRENKVEENKLSQCISHGMNVCPEWAWGGHGNPLYWYFASYAIFFLMRRLISSHGMTWTVPGLTITRFLNLIQMLSFFQADVRIFQTLELYLSSDSINFSSASHSIVLNNGLGHLGEDRSEPQWKVHPIVPLSSQPVILSRRVIHPAFQGYRLKTQLPAFAEQYILFLLLP